MWANHNATYLWDVRNSYDTSASIWDGAVDRTEFEKIARRITEKYFVLDNYYKIDGEPVFMIYDFHNLMKGLGGFKAIQEAFAWFSEMVKEYGLPGVHFQYVKFDNVPIESAMEEGYDFSPIEMVGKVGFKSMSHYQFVHFMSMENLTYENAIELMKKEWELCESSNITYFPHVSIGWDPNIRFKKYDPNVLRNNTPENIVKAVKKLGANNAIGISCGGPLDSKKGIIMSPPNLPGWDNIEIVKILEGKFSVPVGIQNDANACALAEWKYGAGRDCDNMVFLTFGTGMGAGLILDGRLYSGTNDMAGE